MQSERTLVKVAILLLLFLSLTGCVHAQSTASGTSTSVGTSHIHPSAVCLIVPVTLPAGIVGTAYGPAGAGVQLTSANCPPPLTWSISVGSLPAGLSLNTSTGLISGTPSSAGSAAFTIKVTATPSSITDIFDIAFNITSTGGAGAPALPDSALLGWDTSVAGTPSPGSVVTIGDTGGTALCPTTCTYTSSQLQTALTALTCGQTLMMENQLYVTPNGNLNFSKVCDAAHWITISRDTNDATFPPEGTRVTPCYSGIASIPGKPAYPCTSPSRHMPFLQKPTTGAVINIFGSYYRFVGIQWGRSNGYDLDFGILTMGNATACTSPDMTCMNAQPTFNVFDRNIFQGDAQRQTSHAIGLGGTRWVAVIESYIYDISTSLGGGSGDAQPFAWGNGKNYTNSGWGKFTNNFEEASTMGNLFCGSFTEPLSPSTGFDGIPHDFWFSQDWFYKSPLWDVQIGQSKPETINLEGVNYGPTADQEFIMQPTAMQLTTGQSIVIQTWTQNDTNSGINRSPVGTTTQTCGSADCGSSVTPFITVGSGAYLSQSQFQTTYTAPATVPVPPTVTLTRSFSTADNRGATIGGNRTLTASAVFTIVSGAPVNKIALSPKAPDLQIQPSYSDSNSNTRQFELIFTAVKNFTSTTLAWKVDGIGASGTIGGNATVGRFCGITSTSTCVAPGANDTQAVYWSGTQLGNHTLSVTSATGITDSSVINVSTTAQIVNFDGKIATVKNGFELKCGGKFLVQKCVIENDWGSNGNGSGQGGQLFLAHPFNQNGCTGSTPNCQTSSLSGNTPIGYGPFYIADGTFSYIKGIHQGAGSVIGTSDNTLGIRRVSVSQVECDDCSYKRWSNAFNGVTYYDIQFNSGGTTVFSWESPTNPAASYISYRHLTFVGDVPVNNVVRGGVFAIAEKTQQAAVKPFGFTVQDSFLPATTAVTFYDPNGSGSCNIASGFGSNNTEARAMVPCFTTGGYILDHLNLTDSTALSSVFTSSPIWQTAGNSIGFANYSNAALGDYRLCHGLNNPAGCGGASLFAAGQSQQASDSTDLGADIAGLQTVELNVRNGLATPMAISTSSLPDATHGVAYSQTLAVSGGTAPYQWTMASGFIPTGAIDILDYACMPLPDRNSFHLTGDAVKYCHIDANLLWWIKGATGGPSDGEMYDGRYIYQDFTEGPTFSNLSGYKMYVNPVPLWSRYHIPGADDIVLTPGPNKYNTTENCGADNLPQIDNLDVKGELQGPFTDITWTSTYGGSIPDGTPYLLATKYIKGTGGVYQNREQYWLVLGFGQVRWQASHLSGGAYVVDSTSTNTTKTAGGAPTPNFACKVPTLPVVNGLPAGVTQASSPTCNLGESSGTIACTPLNVPGTKTFTVQVEDAVGRIAQKQLSITVH